MIGPKKILFVITKANWGGAQKYVHDVAVAAKKSGYEVVVVYGEKGALVEKLAQEGIRTIAIHGLVRDVRASSDASAYRALKELFKNEKPDIVHLNSAKAAGLGALAARSTGVSGIIFTAHGWAFNEQRPWWQKSAIWILSGTTVLLSHKTICVSEAVARDIRSFPFATCKLVVIRNGVECVPQIAREEAREKLLPAHVNKTWIGMLSELHPTKRIDDALVAFAQVVHYHPDTLLLVCGEGEERPRLEALIKKLRLENKAYLLGFAPDAVRYLSAFDMFLHTSQSEAMTFAVLEAGCASLPVVATRVGGIPEIVEDDVSGFLVPPFSPEKVAATLEMLLADRARSKALGTALHERVMKDFSKASMLKKTLMLYVP